MINNIKGNSHQAISWFLNRNSPCQKGMAWYSLGDEREEPTTKHTLPSKTLIQIWWRNQKFSWQAKVKRIQHHETTFTTNAKGTSLGRKHKKRKIPTKNKPKTIKKMVTGSNAPIKRQRLAGQIKTQACVHFHWSHHSAWLPESYIIILYCQVNHVPIMACNCLLFFSFWSVCW